MAAKEKGKKIGRNKKRCERYRLADRRNINKARKMARRLKKFPQDKQLASAARKLQALNTTLNKILKAAVDGATKHAA